MRYVSLVALSLLLLTGCSTQREMPAQPSAENSPTTEVLTLGLLAEVSPEEVGAFMPEGFNERELIPVNASDLQMKLKNGPATVVAQPNCIAKGTWRIIFDASKDISGEMVVIDFVTTGPEVGLFFRADLNLSTKNGNWQSSISAGSTAGRAGVASAWRTSNGRWMIMAFDVARVD